MFARHSTMFTRLILHLLSSYAVRSPDQPEVTYLVIGTDAAGGGEEFLTQQEVPTVVNSPDDGQDGRRDDHSRIQRSAYLRQKAVKRTKSHQSNLLGDFDARTIIPGLEDSLFRSAVRKSGARAAGRKKEQEQQRRWSPKTTPQPWSQ